MAGERLPLEIQLNEEVSHNDRLYRVVQELNGGWRGQLHLRPLYSKSVSMKVEEGDDVVHRASVTRLHRIHPLS
jgi:hypothetical protein